MRSRLTRLAALLTFQVILVGFSATRTSWAQSAAGGGGGISVQPMFVPVMTTNGRSTPVDPYAAIANPYYSPYGLGMTNQQLGLMMLTTPGRMGSIGSGQLSGVRPGPGKPNTKSSRPGTRTAEAERTTSPVARATRPAGSASTYFTRHSPSLKSEPRGRFNRQAGYFP